MERFGRPGVISLCSQNVLRSKIISHDVQPKSTSESAFKTATKTIANDLWMKKAQFKSLLYPDNLRVLSEYMRNISCLVSSLFASFI